jgi:drug/metabolite transporter (DMT)-like permease
MVTVVVLALSSALCYGVGSVLQHQAAGAEPPELALRADLLVRLARHPRWMIGNVADVVGYLLQLLALRRGALTLVEPLLVTSLLFAFPLAAILGRRRVSLAECVAAAVVTGGLGLFLAVSRPGQTVPQATFDGLAILTLVSTAAVLLLVVSARNVAGDRAALLLGAGAGVSFGYMAAMTSFAWRIVDRGVVHGLGSWELYAVVVSGVAGIFLTHSAFGSGHLRLSLPTMTVVQPLVAVVIGLVLYGERIDARGLAPLWEVVGLLAVTVGVYFLALPEFSD